MNVLFKFFVALLPLLFIMSFPASAENGGPEEKNAWDLWKKGFEAYGNAEELNLSDNKLDALDKFKEALRCFTKVKEKKPNWNKKIITYRIGLCKRKISSLKKEIKRLEQATPTPPPEPSLKGSLEDKKKIAQLEKELEKYKSKHFASVVELESLKREIEKNRIGSSRDKKSSVQVESLLKEKNELDKRYSLLLVKYDNLKKKNQSPESVQKELKDKLYEERLRFNVLREEKEKLLSENKALKDEAGNLKAERTKLKFELKKKDDKIIEFESSEKSIIERLANLRKNSAEMSSKIEKLENENRNTKELFNKKNEECELLYSDLKKLRNNPSADEATKQLSKENDTLRKENQLLTAKTEKTLKEAEKLKQKLTLSENNMKNQNSTLAFVEKERKELKVQIKKTEEELAKQNQENHTLRNKMAALENSAKKNSEELKVFAEKYKELQNRFDSKDTLALKNFSFVKKNKELEEELKLLKTKSTETEKQLAKALESKSKLEKNIEALTQTNKKSIEDLTLKNKKSIEELTLKAQKTSDAHSQLQAIHDNLKKKLEDVQKEKNALLNVRDHNKRLFAEANGSKSQLESAQKEMTKAKEELKKKSQAVSELISEVENFKKLTKDQTEKIAELENKIKKLQTAKQEKAKAIKIAKKEAPPAKASSKLPKNSIQVASNGDSGLPLESKRHPKKTKNKYPVEKKDKPTTESDSKLGLNNTISEKNKKVDNDTIKFLLQSGKKSAKNKDLEAAIWHYQKASQLDPENFDAQKLLGSSLLTKGDYDNASKSLEKARDLKDDDVETLILLGRAYIASGKNRSALSTLNKAALIDKTNPEAQRHLGILCKNIGRNEFAEKKFRKALEFDPKSNETMIELAKLLAVSKGREVEAVELYEKALELGAKPDSQLDQLYKIPAVKNREKKPKAPQTQAEKKNDLKQAKVPQKAVKKQEAPKADGKKKITERVQERLDTETVDFLVKSGEEAEKNKTYEKADWFYNKAAKVDIKNPLPYKKLAQMYSRLKNEYKAMKAYESSNEIFNGDTEVLLPLSEIYIKQGKYGEALNLLNIAAVIDQKNPRIYRNQGEVFRNLKKRDLSEKALLKSFKLDPKSVETALLLTKLYTYNYKDRLNDGKKWYNKAKALGAKPDDNLEAFYREKK